LVLILLAMVPKQGPINGSQYRMITISGRSFEILFPILIQLKGLTELMDRTILMPSGAAFSENWVFPGNKKEGYCKLNV